MGSWWSSMPEPPPAGMRVVPCNGMDLESRELILTTGLIIGSRLDAHALETSLYELIARKLPRLGARFAIRNGAYEFHIPTTFDAVSNRPAVFTVADYHEPYSASGRPALEPIYINSTAHEPLIHPFPDLDEYFRNPDSLFKTQAELIASKSPMLNVHVSIFEDLTFVGITACHCLFDAMGTATFLRSWTRVIAGEIEHVEEMPWDLAPFETYASVDADVKLRRGYYDLGLFSRMLFIAGFIWKLVRDPKEEGKLVRVPKAFLALKKREIMDELRASGSTEWVGSSDVLMAWWFKISYDWRQDNTAIHMHYPVNLREKAIFPGGTELGTPFIGNAVSSITIPAIPASSFKSLSLRDLSLHIRRAVLAYNNEVAAIKDDVQWRCAKANTQKVVFPASVGGEWVFQTNWRDAKYGELDFSAASVQKSKPAPVVFVYPAVKSFTDIPTRGSGVTLMDDGQAVWMGQVQGLKKWEAIRRANQSLFA